MIWQWIILGVYGISLAFVFCFSLVQLNLVYNFFTKRKRFNRSSKEPAVIKEEEWPVVTVQLPLYNEKYVVQRLIDCIARFDFPKDKLEIQVLDDSNDETTALVQEKVEEYSKQGIDIQLIRRPERKGYKAGALKYGLDIAKGEYIAIFDADFLPQKDFLKRLIPYLVGDTELGVVQSRWGHINRDYSLLTKLQAFALDAHFVVEQVGRNSGGHFINFNGTGGVWRKECIYDAGNWESDTLTEDLDLSYRAQMKGWKFRYFKEIESPAELPATMNALKSQQHRWTKGAAETAVKHIGNVWRSNAKGTTKIHGLFHLLNSAIFLSVIISAIISVPIILVKHDLGEMKLLFDIARVFFLSLLSLVVFYATSYFNMNKISFKSIIDFIITFPLFLSMSMGMSLHNALAVIEGYLGKKTPFVRTPKFAIMEEKKSTKWQNSMYRAKKVNLLTWVEGLLGLYFIGGLILGLQYRDYDLSLFHAMLSFGYLGVFYYSFKHASA